MAALSAVVDGVDVIIDIADAASFVRGVGVGTVAVGASVVAVGAVAVAGALEAKERIVNIVADRNNSALKKELNFGSEHDDADGSDCMLLPNVVVSCLPHLSETSDGERDVQCFSISGEQIGQFSVPKGALYGPWLGEAIKFKMGSTMQGRLTLIDEHGDLIWQDDFRAHGIAWSRDAPRAGCTVMEVRDPEAHARPFNPFTFDTSSIKRSSQRCTCSLEDEIDEAAQPLIEKDSSACLKVESESQMLVELSSAGMWEDEQEDEKLLSNSPKLLFHSCALQRRPSKLARMCRPIQKLKGKAGTGMKLLSNATSSISEHVSSRTERIALKLASGRVAEL